jgi:hypothetical protein
MTIEIDTVLQGLLTSNVAAFKATVHGMDRTGTLDIELPDITMAARFVMAYRIDRRTTVHQSNTDGSGNYIWTNPVVLSINVRKAL